MRRKHKLMAKKMERRYPHTGSHGHSAEGVDGGGSARVGMQRFGGRSGHADSDDEDQQHHRQQHMQQQQHTQPQQQRPAMQFGESEAGHATPVRGEAGVTRAGSARRHGHRSTHHHDLSTTTTTIATVSSRRDADNSRLESRTGFHAIESNNHNSHNNHNNHNNSSSSNNDRHNHRRVGATSGDGYAVQRDLAGMLECEVHDKQETFVAGGAQQQSRQHSHHSQGYRQDQSQGQGQGAVLHFRLGRDRESSAHSVHGRQEGGARGRGSAAGSARSGERPSSMRSDVSSAASTGAGGAGDGTADVEKMPKLRSNVVICKNAIASPACLGSGDINASKREKALAAIEACAIPHLVIVLRTPTHLKFRGVYAVVPAGISKIYGSGPRTITKSMVAKYFRYDSGAKAFKPLPSRDFTVCDAVALRAAVWHKKDHKPNLI